MADPAIQSNKGSTSTGAAIPIVLSATKPGSTIVSAVWCKSGSTCSGVTDTQGNGPGGNYTALTSFTDPSNGRFVRLFYALNTKGGANTVTSAANGSNDSITHTVVELPPTAGLRFENHASGAGTMPSVPLTGTQVNDICVMLVNANGGSFGQVADLVGTNADFLESSTFADVSTFDGLSSGGSISISSKTTGAGAAPTNWSAVAVAFAAMPMPSRVVVPIPRRGNTLMSAAPPAAMLGLGLLQFNAPATQPSVVVSALAETWTGQSVTGGYGASVGTLSETWTGQGVTTLASGNMAQMAPPTPMLRTGLPLMAARPPVWTLGQGTLEFNAPSAAQLSVSVAPLVETWTGQGVTAAKLGAVTALVESFTGQAVTGLKAAQVARLIETWSGQAVTGAKLGMVSVLAETWTGRAVTGAKAGLVSALAETFAGQAVTGTKTALVGVLSETWTGQAVNGLATGPIMPQALPPGRLVRSGLSRMSASLPVWRLGQGLLKTSGSLQPSVAVSSLAETWTGQGVTGAKAAAVSPLSESWTGRAVTGGKGGAVARLIETWSGQAIAAAKAAQVARLVETFTGRGVTATKAAAVGVLAETWTGRAATGAKGALVARLAETWTGQTVTRTLGAGVAVAPLVEAWTGRAVTGGARAAVTRLIETWTGQTVTWATVLPFVRAPLVRNWPVGNIASRTWPRS